MLSLGLRNCFNYLSTDFTEFKLKTHYYARVSHPGVLTFPHAEFAENAEDALLGPRLPPGCFFSPPPHQDSLGKINLPPSQPMLSYRIGLTRISRIPQILQVATLLRLRYCFNYLSTDFTEFKLKTHYYARVSHPGVLTFPHAEYAEFTEFASRCALAPPDTKLVSHADLTNLTEDA